MSLVDKNAVVAGMVYCSKLIEITTSMAAPLEEDMCIDTNDSATNEWGLIVGYFDLNDSENWEPKRIWKV